MLRYKKKIDKFLNNWLNENGFNGCTVDLDNNFFYEWKIDKIYYSFVVDSREARIYKQFAEDNGLKVDCDIFLLSFFHELGHRESWDNLSTDEIILSHEIRESLEGKEKYTIDDYYKYYNIPEEYESTMWAINYINSHTSQLSTFWSELQKLIMKFYKKNKIEID